MVPTLVPGLATEEGTRRFASRFANRAAPGHFREVRGMTFSSIGLGTYLGAPTGAVSAGYQEAVVECLRGGVNVFDTAANYRGGMSEHDLGAGLQQAFDAGVARRDEVIVATKAGFIPFTGREQDPGRWFRERYVEPGIARIDDVAGGSHVMTPRYLQHELQKSLKALGLGSVDVFFVHNPEAQLEARAPEDFENLLLEAFEYLEEEANHDRFRWYGLATWSGFLAPAEDPGHLSLERVYELAREAAKRTGAPRTRFGAVEFPVNLGMTAGILQPTQHVGDRLVPALQAAQELGLAVFGSASLLQGRVLGRLPPELQRRLGQSTDAQRALQFARSAPGVTTALVGMTKRAHVEENLQVVRSEPMPLT